MKVTYRIPTRQFGFIEPVEEVKDKEEAIAKYFEYESEYRKQANAYNQAQKENNSPFRGDEFSK